MSREITRACEFSCDEAVLIKTGYANAEDYGKTLLDAMAAVGKYKEPLGIVNLSENKKILKERLTAIMKFERKSKLIRIFTVVLTLCMITGASFLGAYPVAATSSQTSEKSPVSGKEVFTKVEQYYEADCLHLFQTAFSRLDGKEQLSWLEKLYADDDFAFFSIAVSYMAGH